jgi:hypothetical protein
MVRLVYIIEKRKRGGKNKDMNRRQNAEEKNNPAFGPFREYAPLINRRRACFRFFENHAAQIKQKSFALARANQTCLDFCASHSSVSTAKLKHFSARTQKVLLAVFS